MLRLVASDLDGTLLNADSRLAPRTIAALGRAAEQGIEVVAVTGRSHWACVELLRPAKCVRWIICSNGATVWDERVEAIVHDRPVDDSVINDVLDRVYRAFPTVGVSWETSEGLFVTEKWLANRRAADSRFKPSAQRPIADFGFDHGPVLKLMLDHDELRTFEWLNALQPHLPEGLSASTSGATFVEITRGDANKGAALASLCADLGVGAEATVAFGDHSNDVTMLEWVGTSYAMANADPRVVAVADHTAPPHHEDGVAQVLETLIS